MIIKVSKGDILESKVQTLVNTVNCVGVMGKGIALAFKKSFPEMFQDYAARCERNEVKLGRPYLYKTLTTPWVLNFPTKDHWRSVSKIDDIERGLKYLLNHYKEWGITSLAVPPLGCGNGQLEWRIVGPTLYKYLDQMDIHVEIYAPQDVPDEQADIEYLVNETNAVKGQVVKNGSKIQPSWLALVEILRRVENEPYHWPVGRTIFQKMAYIATLQGLPTELEYRRSSYGPYSPQLKGVITKLVNNGLIYESRLGNMFKVKIGRTYADAYKEFSHEIEKWDEIIEKTADLFMRMNTNQAEVVATILFAAAEVKKRLDGKATDLDVLKEVMKWKERRRPKLEEGEVAATIFDLAGLKWLDVKHSKELPIVEEAI